MNLILAVHNLYQQLQLFMAGKIDGYNDIGTNCGIGLTTRFDWVRYDIERGETNSPTIGIIFVMSGGGLCILFRNGFKCLFLLVIMGLINEKKKFEFRKKTYHRKKSLIHLHSVRLRIIESYSTSPHRDAFELFIHSSKEAIRKDILFFFFCSGSSLLSAGYDCLRLTTSSLCSVFEEVSRNHRISWGPEGSCILRNQTSKGAKQSQWRNGF